jgi:hypothetical protein
MLIEHGLYFIITPHDEGVSLVRGQIEGDSLPDSPHFLEHGLNVVLLGSLLPDLNAGIDMVHEPKAHYLLEGEVFGCRVDLHPSQPAHFCPVPLLHALFPEGDHQWQFGLERVHLVFHLLSDIHNLRHGAILEVLVSSDNAPEALLHEFLCGIGVNLEELMVVPGVDVSVPSVDDRPKGVVGGELLGDYRKPLVVRLVPSKQNLARVELPGLFCQLGKGDHDFSAHLHDGLVVGHRVIRMEIADQLF